MILMTFLGTGDPGTGCNGRVSSSAGNISDAVDREVLLVICQTEREHPDNCVLNLLIY